MTRYLVEYILKSPVDPNSGIINIKFDNSDVIIDFTGNTGYNLKPNIKFLIQAKDVWDAFHDGLNFFLPFLNKIFLVYNIKLIIPKRNCVVEGTKGKIERNCIVAKLWDKEPYQAIINQQNVDAINSSDFPNANDKALAYYRISVLSSNLIDQYRNLRLALEALVTPKPNKVSKCDCGEDLICSYCKKTRTYSTVTDNEIKEFWINEIKGLGQEIDEILDMRNKAFHVTELNKIYSKNLDRITRNLELTLSNYLIDKTGFWSSRPDYGRNYYHKTTFRTNYPDQEFPEDFPKEDYWRKIISAP